MKRIPLVVIVSALMFGAGIGYAADKRKAPAQESKPAPCCAKAAEDGRDCPRSCCQEAAAKGRNCKKCGGSGMIETKK